MGVYYPDLWYHPACSGSDMMVLELLVVYTLPSHLLGCNIALTAWLSEDMCNGRVYTENCGEVFWE